MSFNRASKAYQREHRERHQPKNREHLGLLEKKKDYKIRANDRHKKQKVLKLLKRKALNKNPDEFHTHMVNSRIVEGEHREKAKEVVHTPEQIKLMKSKDMTYVEFRRNMESKKIEKMQAQLHMTDVANKVRNTHVFFLDSADEARNFNLAERLNTHPTLLNRKTNRIRKDDLKNLVLPDVDKRAIKERDRTYKELDKRVRREKELSLVRLKLEVEKNLKAKTHKKPQLVQPGTRDMAPIYKWEYERKK